MRDLKIVFAALLTFGWLFGWLFSPVDEIQAEEKQTTQQQQAEQVNSEQVKSEKPDPKHAESLAAGLKLFKEHVREILVEQCLECHGGAEEIEAEFNLVTRSALLKGGTSGPAIVPGKSAESLFYKVVAHKAEPYMPLEGSRLSKNKLDSIAKWIDLGAPYDKPLIDEAKLANWIEEKIPDNARDYWAFQPLKRFAEPTVKNSSWGRNPIDRFVLAKLEAQGLVPNSAASKRQLIRRAYFDLIGLPPTPADIDSFLNDQSKNAYANLLDRLLDSKHFGERWGRHWLDVARFAESHGFEQDYDRPYAFHFRDFVIKALNMDMPFNQFVRWQLAGDEIEPNNPLAMMATGFLGAGVFPTQITKNEVERTRYDALDDMASTVGSGMLGLSIGCARCHSHKYDPLPQADYYRLISTFTTTVRSNIDLDLDPEVYQKAKQSYDKKHSGLVAALEKYEQENLVAAFSKWEQDPNRSEIRPRWKVLEFQQMKSTGGATFSALEDNSVRVGGTNAKTETYTFVAHTDLTDILAIKLEALADDPLKKKGPGRAGNGNFDLTDFKVSLVPANQKDAKPASIKLLNPRATFEQKGLPIAAAIDADPKSGWAVDPQFGKNHAAIFDFEQPAGTATGSVITVTMKFDGNTGHNIGRSRLSLIAGATSIDFVGGQNSPQIVKALETRAEQRSAKQKVSLLTWYRQADVEWQKLAGAVSAHQKTMPHPKLTKVMVCSEGVTAIRHHTQGADFFEKTFYLKRGDTDQKVEQAQASFLQVLSTAPEGDKRWQVQPPSGSKLSYRRLSLANWITDTEYGAGQLLARVIVNRLWQHHMGQGIVATPNDFGKQGKKPTHPELLDWLATELIKNGWRMKPIHKLIMQSSTYRESTKLNSQNIKTDPDNQWYWRRTQRRLEAEVIRDSMLAISGQLDTTMFGAGTLDESQKRRSIYFMIKRSKLIPMMQLFDSPEPLVSVGGRPSTTIAPQALMFLNNKNVRLYAESFGKKLLPAAEKSIASAVSKGYLMSVGRKPDETETKQATAYIENQIQQYEAQKNPQAKEIALANFCQILLSLNEFVYAD